MCVTAETREFQKYRYRAFNYTVQERKFVGSFVFTKHHPNKGYYEEDRYTPRRSEGESRAGQNSCALSKLLLIFAP